jgi:hypothetical protein
MPGDSVAPLPFRRRRDEVIRVRVTKANFLRWQQALATMRAEHEYRNQEEFLMALLDLYDRQKARVGALLT